MGEVIAITLYEVSVSRSRFLARLHSNSLSKRGGGPQFTI